MAALREIAIGRSGDDGHLQVLGWADQRDRELPRLGREQGLGRRGARPVQAQIAELVREEAGVCMTAYCIFVFFTNIIYAP